MMSFQGEEKKSAGSSHSAGELRALGTPPIEEEDLWRNTLPELLLALLGCEGGAFTVEKDQNNGVDRFILSEDVDWMDPADRYVCPLIFVPSCLRHLCHHTHTHTHTLREREREMNTPVYTQTDASIL